MIVGSEKEGLRFGCCLVLESNERKVSDVLSPRLLLESTNCCLPLPPRAHPSVDITRRTPVLRLMLLLLGGIAAGVDGTVVVVVVPGSGGGQDERPSTVVVPLPRTSRYSVHDDDCCERPMRSVIRCRYCPHQNYWKERTVGIAWVLLQVCCVVVAAADSFGDGYFVQKTTT